MKSGSLIGKAQLLESLRDSIAPPERAALEDGGGGLVISRFNRATLLRMLAMGACPEGPGVDPGKLEGLKGALQDYLDRYMPDRPEGHRWIILSCLFLAFIVQEPMHPREIVGWKRWNGGYSCPAREVSEGSLCRWCVCRGEV